MNHSFFQFSLSDANVDSAQQGRTPTNPEPLNLEAGEGEPQNGPIFILFAIPRANVTYTLHWRIRFRIEGWQSNNVNHHNIFQK